MPLRPSRRLPSRGLAIVFGLAVAALCSGCLRLEVGAGGSAEIRGGKADCSWWTGPTCAVASLFEPLVVEATPDAGWELAGFYDSDGTERCAGATVCRVRAVWPSPHVTAVFIPRDFDGTPFLGIDGIVYLYDPNHAKVHRWDSRAERWLTPIVIGSDSTRAVYASATHELYVGYGGTIRRIELHRGDLREHDHISVDVWAVEVLPIGDSLLVSNHYVTNVFRHDGSVAASGPNSRHAVASTWDPVGERVFSVSQYDPAFIWTPIAMPAGTLGEIRHAPAESGVRALKAPLRISRDGARVFSASGEAFDATTLVRTDSIEADVADAAWLAGGELATLRPSSGGSLIERRTPRLRAYESHRLAGTPAALFVDDTALVVMTRVGRQPAFHRLPLLDDVDADGIANLDDAFPDDPAASIDADGDRAPDAWNDGSSAADSTTGLVALDAFPDEAACQLTEHARPGTADCDFTWGVPPYRPETKDVAIDDAGIVYLFSRPDRTIFRWSSRAGLALRPIPVGPGVLSFAYMRSSHRLHLGYVTGEITQIDLASPPQERAFARLDAPIGTLVEAGAYLLALMNRGDVQSTQFLLAGDGRTVSTQVRWESADAMVWSEAAGTLFSYRAPPYQRRILFAQRIDGAGQLGYAYDTVYSYDHELQAPIRVSADGRRLLLGSGEFFDVAALHFDGSLPIDPIDAAWPATSGPTTLRASPTGDAQVEHWSTDRRADDVARFAGVPLRLLADDGAFVVVTELEGRPAFHRHLRSDDRDADGIENTSDDFPDDPAAAFDYDRDGAPDDWNTGRGPEDSTTGLVLDAFPFEAACQLPDHSMPGEPSRCDIAAQIPVYAPDPEQVVVDRDGVLHLLDTEHRRVFRWSIPGRIHRNPIPIGPDATSIAYAPDLHRLYVGYASGALTQVDLGQSHREEPFAVLPLAPEALLAARENLVATASASDLAATRFHFSLSPDGSIADHEEFNGPGGGQAIRNRGQQIVFNTQGDRLAKTTIGRQSGTLTPSSQHYSPYPLPAPWRISADGRRLMAGSGVVVEAETAAWIYSLPVDPSDVAWRAGGSVMTLRESRGRTRAETWDAQQHLAQWQEVSGAPLRTIEYAGESVVVTIAGGRPAFQIFAPTGDADADGIADADDAYPTDPAAALDTDADGAPDAWNPGRDAPDSTTGLSALDAFPHDAACQTLAHASAADPQRCDFDARVADYVPDPENVFLDRDGVVHLLAAAEQRVFRWSIATQTSLDPLAIGGGAHRIAYDPNLHAVLIGYTTGEVRRIALEAGRREHTLVRLPQQVESLLALDTFVYADDGRSAIVVDGAGARTFTEAIYNLYYGPPGLVWSPFTRRMIGTYRPLGSALHTRELDAGGRLGPVTAGPRDPSRYFVPPLRISADGSWLLDASGQVLDASTLTALRSLHAPVKDACFLPDGGLVSIRSKGATTLLERWTPELQRYDFATYPGTPLRVMAAGERVAVITQHDGRPSLHAYLVSDDADGDAAVNDLDAFPHDPAASLDADGDGAPDTWNPGKSASDSTSGLTGIDAFPADSACQRTDHGQPGDPSRCDVARSIPAYSTERKQIVADTDGVVYLLAPAQRRIFRWSPSAGHLNPIPIAEGALSLVHAPAAGRLYVVHDNGEIRRVEIAAPGVERPFVWLPSGPSLIFEARGMLFSRANYDISVFRPDGSLAKLTLYGVAPVSDPVWDPRAERLYSLENGFTSGPQRMTVDPIDGRIAWEAGSNHADSLRPGRSPLHLSPDGTTLVGGSGDVFSAGTLRKIGALPTAVHDAAWLPDGTLVTLRPSNDGRALLESWSDDFSPLDSIVYEGQPLRVIGHANGVTVVTQTSAGPALRLYAAAGDADGDGAPNAADAYPFDPAASIDSDRDGTPDTWNPGRGPADSTDGLLVLDAFPFDSACQRPEQALATDPTRCDIAGATPAYSPDVAASFVDRDGVLHLPDFALHRVFRWSIAEREHRNPLVLDGCVNRIAYSAALHRLYAACGKRIDRIDLANGDAPVPFAHLEADVQSFVAAGSLLVAWTNDGRLPIFDTNGVLLSNAHSGSYDFPRDLVWNDATQEVLERHDPYGYLLARPLDPDTGAVGASRTGSGITPAALGPMRLSSDGTRILLGNGAFFDVATLASTSTLPTPISDALWRDDGSLWTLRSLGAARSLLERWDASMAPLSFLAFDGTPIRVAEHEDRVVVVTRVAEGARFHVLASAEDADGDGVPDAEDAFPCDPAAALDTDRDGAPDAWNPGSGPDASTTGLQALDAFPEDSACQRSDQARADDASRCDIEAGLAAFSGVPGQVAIDDDGVVYLLGPAQARVFRWDAATQAWLNPIPIGADASVMELDPAGRRLFVGYESGRLSQIDLDAPRQEQFYAWIGPMPSAMELAGDLLVVSRANEILALRGGVVVAKGIDFIGTGAEALLYDVRSERLLALSRYADDSFVIVHHIDLVARSITFEFPSSVIRSAPDGSAALALSPDGTTLLGAGVILSRAFGEALETLPTATVSGHWNANASLVTLRVGTEQTAILEVRDAARRVVAAQSFEGTPLAVFERDDHVLVVTQAERPVFQSFVPEDDSDGDGVANETDAFPIDLSASVDVDGDAAPDAWNAGRDAGDSTTGLTDLDAFPADRGCQQEGHGIEGVCDARLVWPTDAVTPWCDDDGEAALPASGTAPVPGATDLVPLCRGWVLLARGSRLEVRNLIDGRVAASFDAGEPVGQIALDTTRRRIFAWLSNSTRIARLDWVAGTLDSIPLATTWVRSIVAGKDGELWISVGSARYGGDQQIYRIAPDATQALDLGTAPGNDILFNAANDELIASGPSGDLSPFPFPRASTSVLARLRFDAATQTLETIESIEATQSRLSLIAASADGTRIAVIGSDGFERRLLLFDAGSLSDAPESSPTPLLGGLLAFDPSGSRLASAGSGALEVFDFETQAVAASLPVPSCSFYSYGVQSVAFSRGGRLAMTLRNCHLDESPEILWLGTD